MQKNKYLSSKNLSSLDLGGSVIWEGETTHHLAEIKGQYLARELYHLEGGKVGFERIFFNEPKNPKRPTFVSGYTGEKSPLFTPVGISFDDLHSASALVIVGGFADAVTVFNAFDCKVPVLGILGESNTSKLVEQIKAKYPDIRLLVALDGDKTGRAQAIKSGVKWCVPAFGDWNDLYISDGLQAVSDALKNINEPIPAFDFDSMIEGTEKQLINKLASATEYKEIADIYWSLAFKNAQNIPVKYKDIKTFIDLLIGINFRIANSTLSNIESFLHKQVSAARKKARSFITMSDRKYNHHYQSVTNLDEVPTNQDGVFLVSASHGLGKTEKIGIPFIKNRTGQAVALCHLRSLVADMATRFEISHYKSYADSIKDIMQHAKISKADAIKYDNRQAFAICLPSIVLTLEEQVRHTKTLLIDEVSQVLSFMTLAAMKGIDNARIFERLVQVIKDAKRILVLDADLDDSVIDFLEMCRPFEKFNIFEMKRPETQYQVEWCYGKKSKATAEQRIIAALADNQRLIIPTDSQATATALEDLIKTIFTDIKLLNINAKTTEKKEVRDFLSSPNSHAYKYQVVIHSPSMRSGVSITKGGFDMCVGVFSGTTICPQDAIQMIRRDRKIKDFLLCVDACRLSAGMNADEMRAAQEELDQKAANIDGRFVGDLALDFDLFRNKQREKEESAKASFAVSLFHQLEAYRFNISHCIELIDDESVTASIKRQQREERLTAIYNAPILNSFEYERLINTLDKTDEDRAAIEKTRIANFFDTKVLTDDHFAIWDDSKGKSKIHLLEGIVNDSEGREDKDKPLSMRTFDKVKSNLLRELLCVLGVSVNQDSITGTISKESEQAFAEWHKDKSIILAYLNLISFKRYSRPDAPQPQELKKAIKGLLDKAGIQTTTNRSREGERKDNKTARNLSINDDKMMRIFDVIKGRLVSASDLYIKENAQRDTKNEQKTDSLENDENINYCIGDRVMTTKKEGISNETLGLIAAINHMRQFKQIRA